MYGTYGDDHHHNRHLLQYEERVRWFIYFCYRIQVTKGIWIAKCIGIEPFTIVMDLEGTDGRDRGEVM